MNGLVLAGGQSSRMGYDKSLIDYHGIPQYEYVYHMLKNYCDEVYISSNSIYKNFPTISDHDAYQNIGPIAGLLSAYALKKTDWIVIAIDYPLISKNEIELLLKSSHPFGAVFYNNETGFYESFLGIYREAFYPKVLAEYEKGITALQKILKQYKIDKIIPKNINTIRSIDTKEQMEELKKKYF